MATHPADTQQVPPVVDELPPAPLSGTRSQALQRLQIGLFGLGAMILLVALANVIMTSAQHNQARVVPEAAPTVSGKAQQGPSDPLADAGVVPDVPSQPEANASLQSGDAALAQP